MEMTLLNGIGLALPAGLNAYIPILGLAMAQRMHWVTLPKPWDMLGEWWAILIIAGLLAIEIMADKVPTADHVNDIVQTFVRPAAGAVLMLATTGVLGKGDPVWTTVVVILGIVLAGGVHAVKAASRPVVNVTTGGVGAPVASLTEDIVAAVITFLAILVPIVAIVGLLLVLAIAGWQIWKWRKKRAARKAAKGEAMTAAETGESASANAPDSPPAA